MPTNSTILLFGATGGIGSVLARQLHERGARLWLAARSADRLEALGAELDAPWTALDVTDFEAVSACAKQAAEALGGLQGAVCCVGSILLKPAHATKREEWDSVIAQNLTAAFSVLRGSAPLLMRQDTSSLVLMSSAAAQMGLPNHEAIAAAKAGIEGLVRAAAASYGPRGLRVNAVAPGLVETPLSASITQNNAARQASEAMHALGRIGRPDEVARAIAFLLDSDSEWITGQIFGIDGGLAKVRSRGRA